MIEILVLDYTPILYGVRNIVQGFYTSISVKQTARTLQTPVVCRVMEKSKRNQWL